MLSAHCLLVLILDLAIGRYFARFNYFDIVADCCIMLQRMYLLWLTTRDREIYGLGLQDAGWPMQGNGAQ